MTGLGMLLACAGIIFLGSLTQRITGVGFGLVAAPLITLILGPLEGVLVVNILGGLTSIIFFIQKRKEVEYRKMLWFSLPALVAIVPGAYLVNIVPRDILFITLGSLVVLSLTVSLVTKPNPKWNTPQTKIVTGFSSGFLNVTAGVGAPAMISYAIATRWPQDNFAINMQFHTTIIAVASVAAKWGNPPQLEWYAWLGALISLGLGTTLGTILAKKLPGSKIRKFVVLLAFAGGFGAILKGIIELNQVV